MVCPKCNRNNDVVIDSRQRAFSVRRRRLCMNCGFRYTTVELLAKNRKAIKKFDILSERLYNGECGSGNG